MSTRFAIKSTATAAEKEGDVFVRYTGVSEPFTRVSERKAEKVGADERGNPKLVFTTGMNERQVEFFKWYSAEEQAAVRAQIKELKPIITKYYGGEDVVKETNQFFWGENRDVSRLSLGIENMDTFYDTKNPAHAVLYLSIISGAFMDTVAPTKDWAERHQIPHYMALETDENLEEDVDITRSDAHAALTEIRKEDSSEALFILAWCIQYDTNAFGAFLKSASVRDLVNYHIKYIDGKLVTKKKRNTPKVFLDYVAKWKGQQTRPALYVEAYVKAGIYFNYINQREKKFVTTEGTILGNTIEQAVEALMKTKFTQDLEKLREQVETKWKE